MKPIREASRSYAQSRVEIVVLKALSERIALEIRPGSLRTGRSRVALDGMAHEPLSNTYTIVEVFAHVGRVKAAQRHKVHADVLKLAMVRAALEEQGAASVRALVAFVCPECALSLLGKSWVADAAARFRVEATVVDIDKAMRADLISVQARQNLLMVEE